MKRTSTQQPVIPQGYTGRNFNLWIRYVQREIDKVRGTSVAERILR